MKHKESKVPVQKGPIKHNTLTQKTQMQFDKTGERSNQMKMLKDSQTMEFVTPKR